MAISQGSTPGTSYTWSASTWDWNEARSTTKTWATAYATAWTCTETDSAPIFAAVRPHVIGNNDAEAWATAETRADVWTAFVKPNESFATAEKLAKAFTKAPKETWATTESYADVWSAVVKPNEAFATAELRRSGVSPNKLEVFATAESLYNLRSFIRNIQETLATTEVKNTWLTRALFEVFATAEARADVWTAIKTNPETLTVAETYSDIIAWIQANLEAWTTGTVKNTELGSINPEAFSVADVRNFIGSFNEPESFVTSDTRRFDGVFNVDDAFTTIDAQSDVVAFQRAFSSAFAFADAKASQATNVELEAFSTLDSVADVIGFARNFAEAMAVAEVKNTALNSINPESWVTNELRASATTNVEPQAVAFAEAYVDSIGFAKNVAEALAIAEARTDIWTALRSWASSWATAEGRVSGVTNVEPQAVAFNEAMTDVAAFNRNWAEAMPIAAAEPTAIFKAFASAFSIAEAQSDVWAATRNYAEVLSWTESYIDNINWIQENNETLGVSDVRRFVMAQVLNQSLLIADGLSKQATKPFKYEAFGVSSSYSDFIDFIQANSESFAVSEGRRSAAAQAIRQTLALRDMFLRGANGVYADISMHNFAMTEGSFQEFVNTRSPTGYAPFRQFLPGDYSFQNALINASMVPVSGASDTMSIQAMTTVIDVPDVYDRGSNAISASGATINFARAFTIIPQVVAQQTAGASTGVLVVSNITTTSFFVRLYSAASPTTGIAGTVSWSAAGY